MSFDLLPLHNEGTSFIITAVFVDSNGVPSAPTSARFRIDSIDPLGFILGWTAINSPTATHELQIDSTYNVMQDESKDSEEHVVTIEATYGVGVDKVTDEYRFSLKNMFGI